MFLACDNIYLLPSEHVSEPGDTFGAKYFWFSALLQTFCVKVPLRFPFGTDLNPLISYLRVIPETHKG